MTQLAFSRSGRRKAGSFGGTCSAHMPLGDPDPGVSWALFVLCNSAPLGLADCPEVGTHLRGNTLEASQIGVRMRRAWLVKHRSCEVIDLLRRPA